MKFHTIVEAGNGIKLFVETQGNPDNTPIIFVHGYPDNHHIWDQLIEKLKHRYYIVTYDVRGAGKSSKPVNINAYKLASLAKDLQAVAVNILGDRAFHLVAHDWGSIQSWESVTSSTFKNKILTYTTLSGPCLDHAVLLLRKKIQLKQPFFKQLAKSWYIGVFHLPILAPLFWKLSLGKQFHRYIAMTEEIKDVPINATQTEDGIHGVKLYRANFINAFLKPRQLHANCPVHVIVLKNDRYVDEAYTSNLSDWVKQLHRTEINAGHWAILSHTDEIAEAMLNYFEDNNSTF